MKTKYPEPFPLSRMIKKSIKINADIPVTEQSLEKHNSSRVPIISIIKQKKALKGDLVVKGVTKFIDEKNITPRGDTTSRGLSPPVGDGLGDLTVETEDIE